MPKITLNVTLTLLGPILTQSSTPGEYGLDAAMARKPGGTPYLPGTLILGRLRQSWVELSEAASGIFMNATKINEYLGRESFTGNLPQRKLIQCSDFVAVNDDRKGSTYRIRIDDERGSVATGAYLVIDSPFAPGEKVKFNGTISYLIPDGTKNELQNAIETGLRWITSFGGQRTVGFGRLDHVDVTPMHINKTDSIIPDDSPTHLRLLIKPHAPFCIARRQIDENLFESEEIIPGSSIKGALASTLGMLVSGKSPNTEIVAGFDNQRLALSAAFEHIRFSHAFPCQREKRRPVKPPLSLVKDQQECELEDVALCSDVKLILNQAPKFAVDWKKSADVSQRFGWPHLDRELRVRTKMDRENRRSDKGKLFAYEMIVPDGHDWEGVIDLSRIGDAETRKKVILQLIDLLSHGLNSWGKTKTGAETWVTGHPGFSDVAHQTESGEKYYLITLQTPAILCEPEPKELNETSGQTELFNAYNKDWTQLSDYSLELTRFFATQSLAGGNYLHNRFQPNKFYYPWLLTDAGSTFVMKVKNEDLAKEKVMSWLKQGLPLPAWAKTLYKRTIDGKTTPGTHWKCCPYIPENGYGEIAVNIDLKNFPAVSKEGADE